MEAHDRPIRAHPLRDHVPGRPPHHVLDAIPTEGPPPPVGQYPETGGGGRREVYDGMADQGEAGGSARNGNVGHAVGGLTAPAGDQGSR